MSARPLMAAGVGAVATIAGVRRVIDEVRSFATAPQPVAMPQSAPQDISEGGVEEATLPGPSAAIAAADIPSDAMSSSSLSEGTFATEQPASQAATKAMSLDDLALSSSTTEVPAAASQAAVTAAPPIIQGLAESYSGLTTTDRIDTAQAAGEVVFSTPDAAAPGVVAFNVTPETSGSDSKSGQSKRRTRGSSTGSLGASKRHPTPFRKSAAPDTAAAVEDDESSMVEATAPEMALLNSGLLATATTAAPIAGLEASSSEGVAGLLPGSAAYRRLLRTAGLPTPKPVGILKRRAGIPAAAGSDAKDSKDADMQAAPGALKRGRAATAHHVSLVSPTTDAVTLPGHSDDSRRARPAPGTPVVTESAASDKPTAADPVAIAPAQADAAERAASSEPPAAALRPASAHAAKGRSTRAGAAPQPVTLPVPLPRSLSPGASAAAGAAVATRTGRVLRTGKAAAVAAAELPDTAQETSAGTKPLAGVKRLHDMAAAAAAPQPPVVSKKARGGAGVAAGLVAPHSLTDDGENSDAAAISQTITSTTAPLVPSKRAAAAAAALASAGTAGVKPAMAPPARVKAAAAGGASRATSVLSRSGPARVSVTEATSSVLFERQAAAAAERERSSKTWRS